MKILIIEDDKSQFETIQKSLRENSLFGRAKITRITTELEFRESFEQIAALKPSLILLDVMLKWTTKRRLVKPDDENQDYFRAGIRCEKLLAADPRTRDIPIIIYTVLGNEAVERELELRPNVRNVDKDFSGRGIERAYKSLRKVNVT